MTHLQCHVEPVVLLRPRRRLRDDHQLRDLTVAQLVQRLRLAHSVPAAAPPVVTLAITNGPDFLLIGRACRVCRIWFDRDQSEDSRVVPIVPDTAYTTGMTNWQTGSKDNNTDSPLVIASPPLC